MGSTAPVPDGGYRILFYEAHAYPSGISYVIDTTLASEASILWSYLHLSHNGKRTWQDTILSRLIG